MSSEKTAATEVSEQLTTIAKDWLLDISDIIEDASLSPIDKMHEIAGVIADWDAEVNTVEQTVVSQHLADEFGDDDAESIIEPGMGGAIDNALYQEVQLDYLKRQGLTLEKFHELKPQMQSVLRANITAAYKERVRDQVLDRYKGGPFKQNDTESSEEDFQAARRRYFEDRYQTTADDLAIVQTEIEQLERQNNSGISAAMVQRNTARKNELTSIAQELSKKLNDYSKHLN